MVIKLDMENSFDRVRHNFLLKFLKKMGIDETFIKYISLHISSPYITPMVNGILEFFFKASMGLRQSFPLSPFLYILMVDSLSRRFEHERETHKFLVLDTRLGS